MAAVGVPAPRATLIEAQDLDHRINQVGVTSQEALADLDRQLEEAQREVEALKAASETIDARLTATTSELRAAAASRLSCNDDDEMQSDQGRGAPEAQQSSLPVVPPGGFQLAEVPYDGYTGDVVRPPVCPLRSIGGVGYDIERKHEPVSHPSLAKSNLRSSGLERTPYCVSDRYHGDAVGRTRPPERPEDTNPVIEEAEKWTRQEAEWDAMDAVWDTLDIVDAERTIPHGPHERKPGPQKRAASQALRCADESVGSPERTTAKPVDSSLAVVAAIGNIDVTQLSRHERIALLEKLEGLQRSEAAAVGPPAPPPGAPGEGRPRRRPGDRGGKRSASEHTSKVSRPPSDGVKGLGTMVTAAARHSLAQRRAQRRAQDADPEAEETTWEARKAELNKPPEPAPPEDPQVKIDEEEVAGHEWVEQRRARRRAERQPRQSDMMTDEQWIEQRRAQRRRPQPPGGKAPAAGQDSAGEGRKRSATEDAVHRLLDAKTINTGKAWLEAINCVRANMPATVDSQLRAISLLCSVSLEVVGEITTSQGSNPIPETQQALFGCLTSNLRSVDPSVLLECMDMMLHARITEKVFVELILSQLFVHHRTKPELFTAGFTLRAVGALGRLEEELDIPPHQGPSGQRFLPLLSETLVRQLGQASAEDFSLFSSTYLLEHLTRPQQHEVIHRMAQLKVGLDGEKLTLKVAGAVEATVRRHSELKESMSRFAADYLARVRQKADPRASSRSRLTIGR